MKQKKISRPARHCSTNTRLMQIIHQITLQTSNHSKDHIRFGGVDVEIERKKKCFLGFFSPLFLFLYFLFKSQSWTCYHAEQNVKKESIWCPSLPPSFSPHHPNAFQSVIWFINADLKGPEECWEADQTRHVFPYPLGFLALILCLCNATSSTSNWETALYR